MTTMMEMQAPSQFDWAHDAYLALDNATANMPRSEKWTPMNNNNSPFSIPPSLLNQASVERYGQITPPEEQSPADPPREVRHDSVPVEQMRNETLWPQTDMRNSLSPEHDAQEPSSKRRRTSRPAATTQISANSGDQLDQEINPQPPKRKRGRPKSQPQMVEAFTADGFPFQVSSARQSHLEKNRVAAHKCRQRKKEYINGLEGRAREFSAKNKALKENVAMLREEVLELKNEVLRHAGCGFWAVDEYLARCAGDLLGMEVPGRTPGGRGSTQLSPSMNTQQLMGRRTNSNDSIPSHMTDVSTPTGDDEFGGFELLRDFEDEDMDDDQ